MKKLIFWGFGVVFALMVLGKVLTVGREGGFTVVDSDGFRFVEFESIQFNNKANLSLSCVGDEIGGFSVTLPFAPKNPPPLRGVFAEIIINNQSPILLEMGYMPTGVWSPREPHLESVSAILKQFANGGNIEFKLPKEYGGIGRHSWQNSTKITSTICKKD